MSGGGAAARTPKCGMDGWVDGWRERTCEAAQTAKTGSIPGAV